jgi:hypothetical protein
MAQRGFTEDDEGQADDIPRPAGTAQSAAIASTTAANSANNATPPKNAFEQAGAFFFGDGKTPGVLGTGQYDPGTASLKNGDKLRGELDAEKRAVDARTAPMMNTAASNEGRNLQMTLAGDLLAASRGDGPSVAQEQLRQGTQANLAAQVAAANSMRGPGAAAGAGQLMATRAAAGQQMASDSALLRAEEVSQARAQLGQVATASRGQDIDIAGADQQIAMEMQRQKDAFKTQLLAMGLNADEAELQAELELKRMGMESYYRTGTNRYGVVKDVAGGIATVAGIGAKKAGG